MDATNSQSSPQDFWQCREVLLTIAKWVVLLVRFPDEEHLFRLRRVSKFFRGAIDNDLIFSVRSLPEYEHRIAPTEMLVFRLNFLFPMEFKEGILCRKREDSNTIDQAKIFLDENYYQGNLGNILCKKFFQIGLNSTARYNLTTFRLDENNMLHLSLREGHTAFFLEFKGGAIQNRNAPLIDPHMYVPRKIVARTDQHVTFHGEIMLIVEEQSNVVNHAVLFRSADTQDSMDDLKLFITALGMCFRQVEGQLRFLPDTFEKNLGLLVQHMRRAAMEGQQTLTNDH